MLYFQHSASVDDLIDGLKAIQKVFQLLECMNHLTCASADAQVVAATDASCVQHHDHTRGTSHDTNCAMKHWTTFNPLLRRWPCTSCRASALWHCSSHWSASFRGSAG